MLKLQAVSSVVIISLKISPASVKRPGSDNLEAVGRYSRLHKFVAVFVVVTIKIAYCSYFS